MLKNAPTLAIVAVHTEENEPLKIWDDLFNLVQFGARLPRRQLRGGGLGADAPRRGPRRRAARADHLLRRELRRQMN